MQEPSPTRSVPSSLLERQSVLVTNIARLGADLPFRGVLGADVLVRFDAFRSDFRHRKLILQGRELPSHYQKEIACYSRKKGAAALDPRHGAELPICVTYFADGGAAVFTFVTFMHKVVVLKVDTGAQGTLLSTRAAKQTRLHATSGVGFGHGMGYNDVFETFVKSGPWWLDRMRLEPQTLAVASLHGFADGLLGIDILERLGSLTFDTRRNVMIPGHSETHGST